MQHTKQEATTTTTTMTSTTTCCSIADLLALSTPFPVLRTTVLDETNRGFKLLTKLGWQQGQGLGANAQGRTEPIATVLKRDRKGIGRVKAKAKAKAKARITHRYHSSLGNTCNLLPAKKQKSKQKQQATQKKSKQAARDQTLQRELFCDHLEGYEAYFTGN